MVGPNSSGSQTPAGPARSFDARPERDHRASSPTATAPFYASSGRTQTATDAHGARWKIARETVDGLRGSTSSRARLASSPSAPQGTRRSARPIDDRARQLPQQLAVGALWQRFQLRCRLVAQMPRFGIGSADRVALSSAVRDLLDRLLLRAVVGKRLPQS